MSIFDFLLYLNKSSNEVKYIVLREKATLKADQHVTKFMFAHLIKLVQDPNIVVKTIDLKFLVLGHSFLPNVSEFGVTESSSKKHDNIFVPEDWFDIIRNGKKKKLVSKVLKCKEINF